jgi:glycosyltransferase involved in cell wall biosynthesis
MKVLVMSQHYWPETFRINEVVDSLRQTGCDVSVLTGQPNYPDGVTFQGYRAWKCNAERHPAGYLIHRVPLVPRGAGTALRMVANYLSYIFSACLAGPWRLRGQAFDVIFVYGSSPILQAIPAILFKRIKKAVLVVWVQDLWPQSLEATGFVRSPRLLEIVARVVRWIYRRSDLLLGQSHAIVDAVSAMATSTPVRYHPNPGEAAFSMPQRPGAPAITLDRRFNVVFAGNLGTVQALDTIVEAASLLRSRADIGLVLIGSGSRGQWLREEVSRRGLVNVQLFGRVAPDAMPAILAQASALLVSLSRSDILSLTVPSKVQAYLAAGRPIVASLDGEGGRIVTEAGAGLVAPAEDARALAQAILQLQATPPEELQRMGEAGRAYYERNFAPGLLSGLLVDHFRQACSASKPGQ